MEIERDLLRKVSSSKCGKGTGPFSSSQDGGWRKHVPFSIIGKKVRYQVSQMDEELLKRRERLTDLRGYPASEKPRNGQLRPNNSLAKLSQLLGDHEPSRAA
jgi:hypothetical protein